MLLSNQCFRENVKEAKKSSRRLWHSEETKFEEHNFGWQDWANVHSRYLCIYDVYMLQAEK